MWSAWLSIHSPQYSSRRSDRTDGSTVDAEERLERVDGRELVRDRADAADPGDDVDDLVRRPADDDPLEVARRLEDPETGLDDLAVADAQPEAALAFDAGQLLDGVDVLVAAQGRDPLVTAVHRSPPRRRAAAGPVRRPGSPPGTAPPSR